MVLRLKKKSFSEIFEKYSSLFSHHSIDVVVYDGYASSTKDVRHGKRVGSQRDSNPQSLSS